MSRGFGAFVVGSTNDTCAPSTHRAGTERNVIVGAVAVQTINEGPCSIIKPKLSKRRPTSKTAQPTTDNRKPTTVSSNDDEHGGLSSVATGGVDLASSASLGGVKTTIYEGEPRAARRRETSGNVDLASSASLGGVDLANSASLGGVNTTICDGEPLADDRRENFGACRAEQEGDGQRK